MVSVTENAYMILRWATIIFVLAFVWYMFFRIRFLEKKLPEEQKSFVVKSCLIPVLNTIVIIFCFSIPFVERVSESDDTLRLVLVALTMLSFLFMVVTFIRVEQKNST